MYLVSGDFQYNELKSRVDEREGWRLDAFVYEDMAQVLAAADVVVARAGATTLLELAALHAPTIVVPNGQLTGGHQLKNAKVYQDALAVVIVTEDDMAESPEVLSNKIIGLLRAPKIRKGLGENFAKFAKPHAAREMAEMILMVVRRQGRR